MIGIISHNLAHFSAGKTMDAFQKDGRQQGFLAGLLSQRFSVLELQWASTGRASPLPFASAGLALLISSLGSPAVRLVIAKKFQGRTLQPMGLVINKGISILEVYVNKILNHSQLIIDSACLTSYVAMIALGHTLIGGLGLAGFGLMIIKKRGYLPGYIEKYIAPFELASSVYAGVVSPVRVIFKALLLIEPVISSLNYLFRNEALNRCVPNFISNKFARTHQIREQLPGDWESKIDATFELNYSSLHSEKLRQILSQDDKNEVKLMDVRLKYEELEQRSLTLGVDFNRVGWKRIKDAVIYDCSADERPINFDYGLEFLKVLLIKMSKANDEQFAQRMIELSDIGASCFEGWLRDIGVMLNSKTKDDFSWAVHYQLAVMRDGLLMESLAKIEAFFQAASSGQISLSMAGGIDGVHLVNQMAKSIWHKWRTYKGEVLAHLEGRSFVEKLFQKGSDIEWDAFYGPHKEIGFMERQFRKWGRFSDAAIAQICIELPVPILAYKLSSIIEEYFRAEYNIERMVNTLYDAIKPQYVDVLEHGSISHQSLRKIEWGAITSWFSVLYNKGIDITGDFNGFNPEIVAVDEYGSFFLTEKGVKLLLWDLGIIQPV